MKRGKVDLPLAVLLVTLLITGMVMVFSASAIMANSKYGSLTYFFRKQAIWGVLSLILMISFSHFKYSILKRKPVPYIILGTALVLLIGLFVFGAKIHGARRWYHLGLFNFQPSELAKWSLIIFFAYFLADSKKDIKNLKKSLLPLMGVLGVTLFLIMLQPDLSTSLMIGVICLSLVFIGGAKIRHLGAMALLAVPALVFMMSYQLQRIITWWHALDDPLKAPYQVLQSLIGLGRGGWFGFGLGQSKQKFFFLPDSHTDFIFSILGEEAGFIGTTIVLILFMLFLIRGLLIARKTRDHFGKFLAIGITLSIVLYALINAAVVSMLVPATGLPMPFISYGGSNIIFLGIGSGILLSISRGVQEAAPASTWEEFKKDRKQRLTRMIVAD